MPLEQPRFDRLTQGVALAGDFRPDAPQHVDGHYDTPLSSAQILALFTTPVQITPILGPNSIPLQTAGYHWEFERVEAWFVPNAAPIAYASVHDLVINYGGAGVQVSRIAGTGFLDQTTAQNRAAKQSPPNTGNNPVDITPADNTALFVTILTGNPTTGNGTLKLRTFVRRIATTPAF